MTDEPFSLGSSFLHRGDPRVKLGGMAALALLLALTRSLAVAAAGLALGIVLTQAARLPWQGVARRLLLVNGFIGLLWLMVPFSLPGAVVMQLGPVSASAPGVQLATLVTLKANAIVLLMLALLATSPAAVLGQALLALGAPRRLGYLLMFSYRYIFVIGEEFQRLHRAARLRCFRPRSGLHTWRSVGWMLGMTLVRSWNRAERVRLAMVLRGFRGELRSPWVLQLGSGDWLLLLLLMMASLSLFWLGLGQ